jgi:DNA-binding CsgD family transcriptional regulator
MEITAGLICENGELFGIPGTETNFVIIGGQCVSFNDAPQIIHDTVEASITSEDAEELDKMGIKDPFLRRNKWVSCNASNKDTVPDYVKGRATIAREFTICGQRDTCSSQGKLCRTQSQITGLTKKQVIIMRLIFNGYQNKEIAHKMGIKLVTVETHIQNIRIKTGDARKADLVRTAQKLNLTQNV